MDVVDGYVVRIVLPTTHIPRQGSAIIAMMQGADMTAVYREREVILSRERA